VIWLLLAAQAPSPPEPAPPPVTIQTTPAAAQPDPARIAAAERLIALMKVEATLDAMFVQLSPGFAQAVLGSLLGDPKTRPVIDSLVARAPDNRDRMIAILSQEFMAAIKRQYPAYLKRVAVAYATAFTAEELDAINAFYSSGPGAKALAVLPQLQIRLSQDGRELGRIAGQEAGGRAFQRIEAEMVPASQGKTS
jgi:hypothetical protein